MVESRAAQAPNLSKGQRLWLLELGLDRPTLARLGPVASPPGKEGAVASQTAQSSENVSNKNPLATTQGVLSKNKAGAPSMPGSADRAAHANQPPVSNVPRSRGQDSPAAAALAALRQGGRSAGSVSGAPMHEAPAGVSTAPTVAPGLAEPVSVALRAASTSSERDMASLAPPDTGTAPEQVAWSALNTQIQSCTVCELHTGRFNTVAGGGSTQTGGWLIVGEAPGERDERTGEPFQGKAGELLHAMLRASGMNAQDEVFYTNLVKCRPRNNRPPTPEQIEACRPHLQQQVALLRPRGILALGRLAAQALVAERRSFEELRGQIHYFSLPNDNDTVPIIVTYHPASLLSRPQHKAAAWRDLNLARTLAL